jgi:hypothetical protein
LIMLCYEVSLGLVNMIIHMEIPKLVIFQADSRAPPPWRAAGLVSPKRPLYINLGPVQRPADRLFGIPHVRWYRVVGLLPADTMGDLLGGSTGAQSYHSPTKLAQGSERPLQLTSTSGPPDGRSTGCLASHTSGCTVRLLHCRSIDEMGDLLSGSPVWSKHLSRPTRRDQGDRYIDFGPA